MNNKIPITLIIILSGLEGFLLFQQNKLNKKIEELSTIKGEENISALPTAPKEASPFDKPNTDPLADEFGKTRPTTTIAFPKQFHDFGRINEGDVVRTTFKFTNTGNKPLYILGAESSCGCTVPQYSREPIKSGATGEITVEFDSQGKRGEVQKTVTVHANTNPSTTTLIIKSTIVPKDK